MSKHFSEENEKARLETFIDAILAIIVTILVLEFKVPENAYSSDREIKTFLYHLLPSVFSYVISFATIISLWVNHHDMFRHIKRLDIRFVLLNFLFILVLSPLPFTTALAGRNHESSFAVALVATNYFLMNLAFSFLWSYVLAKKMMPDTLINSKEFKKNKIITLIAFLLLLVSIPLAFLSTYVSFAIFIIVITMHIGKEFFD